MLMFVLYPQVFWEWSERFSIAMAFLAGEMNISTFWGRRID